MILNVYCIPMSQMIADNRVIRKYKALAIFNKTDQDVNSMQFMYLLLNSSFEFSNSSLCFFNE